MANLIYDIFFLKEDNLPTTDLIPGEVFITGDFNDSLVINLSTIKNMYIVDIHRRLIRVSKWCHKCNAFHIENNKYHKLLGKHWKKYLIVHTTSFDLPIINECRM